RAAAARQEQVPGATGGDEVAGQQRADPAGTAGDHNCPVRVPYDRVAGRGRDTGEPSNVDDAVADDELALVARGEQLPDRERSGGGALQVGEDQPAGVFGLGGADEAPHRGPGQVAAGDRVPGEQDQRYAYQPVVGQPVLDQLQRTGGRRVYRLRRLLVARLAAQVGHREQDRGLGAGQLGR